MIPLIFAFFIFIPAAFSETVESYLAKGKESAKAGDYKKAIREYNEALVLEPNNLEAHLFLGLVYAETDDLDQALAYGQKASQLEPSYVAFYNLGLIHAARKEAALSLGAFEEALRFNPKSFTAEYQKGLVLMDMKDNEKAAQAFRKSLELNPQFGDARLALGALSYEKGDKWGASKQIAELRKAHRQDLAKGLEDWVKEKEAEKKSGKR